jgi:uncharacterized protein YjbI with pentapeptide repeats
MESTIKCGKHLCEHAVIADSRFIDVNLERGQFDNVNLRESTFTNVNLSRARFHDINFSDVTFAAAQIGGALFKHIGPPPDKAGKQEKQRPVAFEEATLCGSTFRKVDLSQAQLIDCNIEGMTINGLRVEDLLEAYHKLRG